MFPHFFSSKIFYILKIQRNIWKKKKNNAQFLALKLKLLDEKFFFDNVFEFNLSLEKSKLKSYAKLRSSLFKQNKYLHNYFPNNLKEK